MKAPKSWIDAAHKDGAYAVAVALLDLAGAIRSHEEPEPAAQRELPLMAPVLHPVSALSAVSARKPSRLKRRIHNLQDDTVLGRRQLAQKLTEHGYKIAESTLA